MIKLDCAGHVLDLSRTQVMGVLNITPDSFYAGSRCQGLDKVLQVAESMVRDGVDILDVGGESTRPGADGIAVTCDIELERVIPVVEALSKRFDVPVSVDTSSALVMVESCKAGAGMVNDVRALHREGAMAAAASVDVPLVLMHSLIDQPASGFAPHYVDVAAEVAQYLLDRVRDCESSGISKNRIILDPGFGGGMFGKTPAYDLSLLKHLNHIVELGFPVLAGMSRKSFVGAVLDKTAENRLYGSLAVVALAVQAGAQIVRVHDVAETKDVINMVDAVRHSA